MKTTGILPPFLPIEEIKKTVLQVLPDFIIETDTNFEKSDAEILVVTIFTPVNSELLDKFPNVKFIQG
ncbi:MAG: hydroxyacid dehydrogenase, partial [Candidatus Thermoplasmatota archaeon]|nr:hydroxyacid dehydrogenase [Candidatus Thermoplasmatota archaeon]